MGYSLAIEKPRRYGKKIDQATLDKRIYIENKIAELDGNMRIGNRYEIKKLGTRQKNDTTDFTGELIQIENAYYVFRNRYVECFLKVDFITGEYRIEEVE